MVENRKIIGKINENRSLLFEKINMFTHVKLIKKKQSRHNLPISATWEGTQRIVQVLKSIKAEYY